jgi:hypothetical protein
MALQDFYAELLSNIGSINLIILLTGYVTASTQLVVPPNASEARLHHEGEIHKLTLPANANPTPHELQIKFSPGQTNISCRLPLASPPNPPEIDNENYAPWSAPELLVKSPASFCCRECGSDIISNSRISQWKDLPSGNWAEMMDFWHCHKPQEKGNQSNEGKYSVFNRGFAHETGTGLIGQDHFLVTREDCSGVQVS